MADHTHNLPQNSRNSHCQRSRPQYDRPLSLGKQDRKLGLAGHDANGRAGHSVRPSYAHTDKLIAKSINIAARSLNRYDNFILK